MHQTQYFVATGRLLMPDGPLHVPQQAANKLQQEISKAKYIKPPRRLIHFLGGFIKVT
jgi:hypothetical protein